jgi:hypothetical protein
VFVKEWKGAKATTLFYPQNSSGKEVPLIANTQENRHAICKIVQEWNCSKEYNSTSNNCQKLASKIFESVGTNGTFSQYDGFVGNFIKHVSNTGEKVNACLVDNDGMVLYEWKTHADLDKWHN